jgi:urease accessory protein UreF
MVGRMLAENAAESAMRRLWQLIDSRAWDELAEVLAPELRVHYVHTGENLTRDAFVRLNREYPGRWRAEIRDVVAAGPHAVTLAMVTDGSETHHVASFGFVSNGRIVDLVEVWAEGGVPVPEDRRPWGAMHES